MSADINTQDFFFIGQQLFLFILAHILEFHFIRFPFLLPHEVKQAHLARDVHLFLPVLLIHQLHGSQHFLLPGARQAVHRPGFDKILQTSLVELFAVQPVNKVLQARKGTVFLPFLHDIPDHILPDAFDGGQAVPDPAPGHGKISHAFIDIGRKKRNSHISADQNIF